MIDTCLKIAFAYVASHKLVEIDGIIRIELIFFLLTTLLFDPALQIYHKQLVSYIDFKENH